jgi:YegS/Rv2252/BmrU family lipid kinase
MIPVVIVNPNSAGGQTRKRWPQLEASIKDALGEFHPLFTEHQGHATELCRSAVQQGTELVIAMGGDGTINEVVNGFFDGEQQISKTASFAVLPAGTGGDFVKTAGVPKTLVDAARAIKEGTARPIDAARLRYMATDGKMAMRHFVNIASFGISGLVDRYVNKSSKSLGGKASFAIATLKAGVVYKNAKCRLRLDGGAPVERTINTIAVANGRFFGGGMEIAPDARLDDGRFDVVTIGDVGLFTMARHSGKIYQGTHTKLPFVTCEKASRVEAESVDGSEVLLDVDGEQPGRLPASFEILPGALRVTT